MTSKGYIELGLGALVIAIGVAFGIQTFGVQTFGATSVVKVFQGGTGASTLSGCLTGNGTGAITGSGVCNKISTSTADTANQVVFFTSTNATPATLGGNAALTFSTAGLTLLTVTNASTTSFSVHGNEVSGERYPVWTMATSTAWTGTTTSNRLLAPFAGSFNSFSCHTDTGTLDVVIGSGTASTTLVVASTTPNTITLSSPITFSKGNTLEADFGTPASTPTLIYCTGIATGY